MHADTGAEALTRPPPRKLQRPATPSIVKNGHGKVDSAHGTLGPPVDNGERGGGVLGHGQHSRHNGRADGDGREEAVQEGLLIICSCREGSGLHTSHIKMVPEPVPG